MIDIHYTEEIQDRGWFFPIFNGQNEIKICSVVHFTIKRKALLEQSVNKC